MMSEPNSIKRSTGEVTATITWPPEGPEWWGDLDGATRNEVRDLLDAACDLIVKRLTAL